MPVACPACARPNNERLTACLYCGEELPAPEIAPEEIVPRDPARETSQEADEPPEAPRPSLLVLAPVEPGPDGRPPPERVSPERLAAVSSALGLDAYLARKTLVTCYPRIVARGEEAPLRRLGERLGRVGLLSTVVVPAALDALGEAVAATSLRIAGDGGLILCGADGEERVRPGTVQVLLRAEIRVEWVGPRPEGARRAALRDRAPEREELERVRSDYPVLEIQRPPERRLRLSLAHFDWSGLGTDALPSALLNLEGLVRRLVAESPEAVLDTGFRFLPSESDPIDGIFGALGSNEGQFDRYACVVGAHWAELRAGRAIGSEEPPGARLSRPGP